ncbi:3-oxoacyl-[acyl-carrier protein] reductase [Streptomyces sp. DvalAA-14]|uniref:3-oxoacyl-ACP reductase n=1 Tax=unclassified Streptomyces TaxID=2593676 RepID=UPI00081B3847|nr:MULTISPECIES: 3-oxoacyl-ACP reductase [unclassified Streptomyces]MYS18968.1 3-oxoacyl-ACP reductase [Streptomyces sp. SID4948]SCD32923.1 3-oxoacyl-[acyl-carrier protein] reductase [Streptomyces sp. DvalAA-14]
MADRYLRLTGTAPGRFLTRRLGLPQPAPLRRWSAEHPSLDGPVLRLAAGEAAPAGTQPYAAVVLDATGIADPAGLRAVHTSLHPLIRRIAPCGRVVVLGARPGDGDVQQAAAQQALEGFVRSLGKEIGRGGTVQLVRLAPGAAADSTLGFLLSPKSAYVSGQVIEVGPAAGEQPDGDRRRTALVTGAARGIGAAVAATLARDGAHVVCLDVPRAGEALGELAARLGGTALPLDITAPDAGERIGAALAEAGGGLDVLVHNAGITRDRRFANLDADRWDAVLEVNLASVLRTTEHLLEAGVLNDHGRIVATASIAGIAGNAGQTNYAASKAGIIGFVRALAADPALRERGITVNAVAPGFIETGMTAAVPLFIREAGRRMNSLGQGGQPVDVAEAVAWLASAASGGISGQVVRVCGQSLLGA